MKAVPLVNEQGHFLEDVLVEDSFEGTSTLTDQGTIIAVAVPTGLYKPRWNFEQSRWEEGLSVEEIAELHKPTVSNEAEQIRHEMAEQNAVMWDFILSGGVS